MNNDHCVLLFTGEVERTGGEGCFDAGCCTAFGIDDGVGCLMAAPFEVLTAGIGLMVTSTFGAGVDRFKRNQERIAITDKTVKIRMSASPSHVIRK